MKTCIKKMAGVLITSALAFTIFGCSYSTETDNSPLLFLALAQKNKTTNATIPTDSLRAQKAITNSKTATVDLASYSLTANTTLMVEKALTVKNADLNGGSITIHANDKTVVLDSIKNGNIIVKAGNVNLKNCTNIKSVSAGTESRSIQSTNFVLSIKDGTIAKLSAKSGVKKVVLKGSAKVSKLNSTQPVKIASNQVKIQKKNATVTKAEQSDLDEGETLEEFDFNETNFGDALNEEDLAEFTALEEELVKIEKQFSEFEIKNSFAEDTTGYKTVATPVFNVASGLVDNGTTLTISCATEGSIIYYTIDGKDPSFESTEYNNDKKISLTDAVTIKAIAVKNGMNDSPVASAKYTVKIKMVKINGAKVTKSIGYEGCPFYNASETSVTVNSFNMAETELTYEKWYEVYTWATSTERNESKYTFANKGREGRNGEDGAAPTERNKEPVTCISWRDAVIWCNAVSEMEGLTPVYWLEGTTDFNDSSRVLRLAEDSAEGYGTAGNLLYETIGNGKTEKSVINPNANGYRLPTEAEWEYAARGGNPSAEAWNYIYAGTNDIHNLENYAVYCKTDTANVKSKGEAGKNAAGLWDMSGNVNELCQDISYAKNGDPCRVIRGGNWSSSSTSLKVAYRSSSIPYNYGELTGFRVASSIQ